MFIAVALLVVGPILALLLLVAVMMPDDFNSAQARPPAVVTGGQPPSEPRRLPNEIRAADLGDQWPLAVDRVVLACQTRNGRPMATARTFDNREFALNGAAQGPNGYPKIDPIWKAQVYDPPEKVLDRVAEADRRKLFAAIVACEDAADGQAERETSDVMKQVARSRALAGQCKAKLLTDENLTADESALITREGILASWPPLTPGRVNIGPLITEALKLCGR